jgi:hypothetical protein
VYLYAMCALGILLMAFGALSGVLGIVHVAAPQLKQGDPLSRIVTGVVNVVESVFDTLEEQQLEECEEFSDVDGECEDVAAQADSLQEGLEDTKAEIDRQARMSGINETIRGIVLFAIGAVIWRVHDRRTRPPQSAATATPVGAPPPWEQPPVAPPPS